MTNRADCDTGDLINLDQRRPVTKRPPSSVGRHTNLCPVVPRAVSCGLLLPSARVERVQRLDEHVAQEPGGDAQTQQQVPSQVQSRVERGSVAVQLVWEQG